MTLIGRIESLWRYPVKSMRGHEVDEAFVGFSGVFGDRCYAIGDSSARAGLPYLTATRASQMLQYEPRFRHPERAARPPNLLEAREIAPGVTPANAAPDDLALDVVLPSGDVVDIDNPALLEALAEGARGEGSLTVRRSDRALTDCRPLSLIALQTIRQIGEEAGAELDKARFRANVYVDFASDRGFEEDPLVGRTLRLGADVRVAVLERDPRCKMISLDPRTGGYDSSVLRSVALQHEARAGVYCAVLVEGMVHAGDDVSVDA